MFKTEALMYDLSINMKPLSLQPGRRLPACHDLRLPGHAWTKVHHRAERDTAGNSRTLLVQGYHGEHHWNPAD